MMEELEKEIQRRCRSTVNLKDVEEDEEEETLAEEKFDELPEEELPFQDILAEKRRDYTAKEEFVYLLYNDILRNFVNAWDGTFLRKKPLRENSEDSVEGETELREEESEVLEANEISTTKIKPRERPDESWKLIEHDEHVDVQFVNKNIYVGRVSRKMMEGEGSYKWNNGVRYKGEFEANRIEGKGLLEWSDNCWYEGEFVNGYRHGRGTMVDGDYHRFYIGNWRMGHKHGKGYCHYAENDSYDGDWVMGKRQGVGYRIYANGARYVGEWQNDFRHGIGTMAWANGDVYRGAWENGQMNGYGEYVWNAFFNKTLTWPQECSYVGEWHEGMRHGKGILRLNSIGGARYSGDWKCNKKHGYGLIIGNNGEVTEGDPLFLKDILVPEAGIPESILEAPRESQTSDDSCLDIEMSQFPMCDKKLIKILKPRKTSVSKPEHLLSIWYHICRLLKPDVSRESSVRSIPSGKCHVCEHKSSCCCLRVEGTSENSVPKSKTYRSSSTEGKNINAQDETKSIFSRLRNSTVTPSASTIFGNESLLSEYQVEERWLYNCIKMHMTRIRQIYDKYARLFSDNPPNCLLTMSRLSLWQFWRDCGIHKNGLSLIEVDTYLAMNESAFIEDAYYPFEKIEIWQFLHALLETAWHLYTKHGNINITKLHGKLGSGLHKFLEVDVYPNVENHVGLLLRGYIDTLSIFSVYQLYREIGYPPSVKELLRSMCSPQDQCTKYDDANIPPHLLDGINCVTVGERISYLPKHEESLTQQQSVTNMQRNSIIDLYGFRFMGPAISLEIIAKVCPPVKDTESDIIVNTDYKLTALEFHEILLEATTLMFRRKSAEVSGVLNPIQAEAEVAKGHDVQQTKLVRSSVQKSGKSRKK